MLLASKHVQTVEFGGIIWDARIGKQRWRDIDKGHQVLAMVRFVAWPTNHQRDMGGGIDHRPLAHAIVVAKQFAVIRREDDHRVVIHAFFLQFGDDTADLIIDE